MDAKALVSQMTLEEKAGFVSGADFWHLKAFERLGIKRTMVADGPHGLRKQADSADHLGINDSIQSVCFPTAAGTACSFDRDMLKKLGQTLGEEAYAEGLSVLLGPGTNIKRSPLCGRNFEYFSEDPYLAGELSAAYIEGVQSKGVGVSLKHFAANNQEKRRMSVSSVIDERTMREIYLAAFETAVKKSKPATLMCAYNKLNGTYCSENKKLLTDILRDEWGFEGYVMSDWSATADRVKGLEAGLDLEMPSSGTVNTDKVLSAVRNGILEESVLDKACERILKHLLATQDNLDHKYVYDREEHHKTAREIARQSMVLLKNDDKVLPLKANQKIAFIGEFAEKTRYQGGGSSHINSYKVLDALTEAKKYADSVTYAKGFEIDAAETDGALLNEAVATAKNADVAVIFAGVPESLESEGYDRPGLSLSEAQNTLIGAVAEVQPDTVVVLYNSSAIEMPWAPQVKGILEAYLAGETAAGAVCDLLFGQTSPSGKLAETFPLRLSDTPCYANFPGELLTVEYREGIFVGYRYYDTAEKAVLFPFGHGLTYTQFEYSDLKITPDGENVRVGFKIKNTGDFDAAEIAQVYVSAPEASSVFRAKKELKGFEKVFLKKGEEKEAELTLDRRAFSYYNTDINGWHAEPGEYKISVGASCADIKLAGTVKIDGKKLHPPYSKKDLVSYFSADVQNVSDEAFEKLLDRPLPPSGVPEGYVFDFSSTMEQAKNTKWGKRLYNIVTGVKAVKDNPMAAASVTEMPVNNLICITQGKFSLKEAHAMVNVYNGVRPIRSLLTLLKWVLKSTKMIKNA